MELIQICGIAAGGALGAYSRFRLSALCLVLLGKRFPWGTLLVNGTGSFLAGLLAGLALTGDMMDPVWQDALSKGFLGALTTFSTFSLDTMNAFREGKAVLGLCNILLNIILCLAACAAGFLLAG